MYTVWHIQGHPTAKTRDLLVPEQLNLAERMFLELAIYSRQGCLLAECVRR